MSQLFRNQMDIPESMAKFIFFLILPFLFIPASAQFKSDEQGQVFILVSETGVDFAKDLLIDKAISTLIPLQLSDLERRVKIPLIGRVRIALSNITIYRVSIDSSSVETGEDGVVLRVSVATGDLSMRWAYSYTNLFFTISDDGDASIQVDYMDVRVAATLNEQDGSLQLSLLECGCQVKAISIDIHGGASWLYQGVVDAFQKTIISKIETAVSKKIKELIEKLDSLLQSIPRQKKIDDVASLNLTFIGKPVLGDSSVEVEIDGLIIPNYQNSFSEPNYRNSFSEHYLEAPQTSISLNGPTKMVNISLEESVFNSATSVYFNANKMNLIIDNVPNQSILNTADWKLIIPELYQKYPNDKMQFNVSVTSPPAVSVTENGIDATILLDVTIDVLNSSEVVPVACISSVLSASCSAELSKNNLAGSLKLIDFTASLKWSKVGDLQKNSVPDVMSIILEAAFFPNVNSRLQKGFPLPIPHHFTIMDADILYGDAEVTVCSDIAYKSTISLYTSSMY